MQISRNTVLWATSIFWTTAQAVQVAHLETFGVGPFIVQNCKSNTQNIATLLKSLGTVLRPVITDLGSPVTSDAYATFFKDVSYAPYVRDILTNVTIGASVLPWSQGTSSPPVLVCIDGRYQVSFKENDRQVDGYDRCQSGVEIPAMSLLQTPYILICPKFFTHPAIPVKSTKSCYTVDPSGRYFLQDGKTLVKYQIWNILHELVHYYVWSTEQKHLDAYGINHCLLLPGSRAVLNPQSYSYYAANIRLGCTTFPTVRTRPPGRGIGVELLEMDGNGTVFNANESIALVVQNVSISAVPSAQTSGNLDPDLTSRTLRKRKNFQR